MGGRWCRGRTTYSDGSTRISNGFTGSPGEVGRFDENAQVLSRSPAATPQGDNEKLCDNLPGLGEPTCANPHGIQAREDLTALVTSEYAEPRQAPPEDVLVVDEPDTGDLHNEGTFAPLGVPVFGLIDSVFGSGQAPAHTRLSVGGQLKRWSRNEWRGGAGGGSSGAPTLREPLPRHADGAGLPSARGEAGEPAV